MKREWNLETMHVLKRDFKNMEVFFTNGMLCFFHKSCASNFYQLHFKLRKVHCGPSNKPYFPRYFLHRKVHSHLNVQLVLNVNLGGILGGT
jgi:hypothetical protein